MCTCGCVWSPTGDDGVICLCVRVCACVRVWCTCVVYVRVDISARVHVRALGVGVVSPPGAQRAAREG